MQRLFHRCFEVGNYRTTEHTKGEFREEISITASEAFLAVETVKVANLIRQEMF